MGKQATRVAIYPGSFDPVTRGHLDLAHRARRLFDRVTVAVLENPAKNSLFTVEERLQLLRQELADADGFDVVSFQGLAVALAASKGADWIVRGLRSAGDAASEIPMAVSNRRCGDEETETVFLAASPEVGFIASRLVREIAAGGGRLESFVTPGVEAALRGKAGKR